MARHIAAQEVLQAVRKGDFDTLLGTAENEGVEFKGGFYLLDSKREKIELAKDVSALANCGGGIIVIGIGTIMDEDHPHEVADRIRAFKETDFNIRQYEDAIAQYVYPRPGIEIRWCPSATDHSVGLGYVSVPESSTTHRPFLVMSVLQENDKVLGNVVGFFERKGDRVLHWSAEDIYRTFKDGLRFDQHLMDIHQALERGVSQSKVLSSGESSAQTLNLRIEKAIEAVGLKNDTSYVLAGYPDAHVEIAGLFESRTADIVKLIDGPPRLRRAGFDILAGEESRIIDGQSRRSVLKSYKLLEVWRDATAISVSSGDEDFLCWGNYAREELLRINTIALVESAYLFCLFVKTLLELANAPDCQIQMELLVKNIPQDKKYVLPKGMPDSSAWRFNLRHEIAPTSEQDIRVRSPWVWRAIDPERAAYELIGELYAKFGVEHDFIPYVTEKEGKKVIDVEQIKSLG